MLKKLQYFRSVLGFPIAIIALSLAVYFDKYGLKDTYVNFSVCSISIYLNVIFTW